MQRLTEYIDAQGGVAPGWLIATAVLPILAGLGWIAALACGLIGVRRPRRRGLAIAALVVAGIVPVLCCSGAFV